MTYLSKLILPLALVCSSAFAVDMAEFGKLHPAGFTSSIGFASPTIGYTTSNHTFTVELQPTSGIEQYNNTDWDENKAVYSYLSGSYKLPVTERLSAGITLMLEKRFPISKHNQYKYKKYYEYFIKVPVEYALNSHLAIGVSTEIYSAKDIEYDVYSADSSSIYASSTTETDKGSTWFDGTTVYFRYNF